LARSKSTAKKCSKTRSKLEEARFFLSKLKDKENWDGNVISYYLSAFISSSRSALWIMRCEYKSVSGWQAWYDLLKPTTAQAGFIKKITDIRNRSEKEGPLQVGGKVVLRISKEHMTEELKTFLKSNVNKPFVVALADPAQVEVTKANVDLINNRASSLVKLDKVFFTLNEFPNKDVITVCNRYFNLLNGIVRKCESLFGIPGEGAVLFVKKRTTSMAAGVKPKKN
jgi:hypothetical protein